MNSLSKNELFLSSGDPSFNQAKVLCQKTYRDALKNGKAPGGDFVQKLKLPISEIQNCYEEIISQKMAKNIAVTFKLCNASQPLSQGPSLPNEIVNYILVLNHLIPQLSFDEFNSKFIETPYSMAYSRQIKFETDIQKYDKIINDLNLEIKVSGSQISTTESQLEYACLIGKRDSHVEWKKEYIESYKQSLTTENVKDAKSKETKKSKHSLSKKLFTFNSKK